MQLRSDKEWFRRRSAGLGWRPATWQGWLVTVLAAALVAGLLAGLRRSPARVPAVVAVVAAYALVVLAAGGG
jgi:CHASE2 domain-containing sensor protein